MIGFTTRTRSARTGRRHSSWSVHADRIVLAQPCGAMVHRADEKQMRRAAACRPRLRRRHGHPGVLHGDHRDTVQDSLTRLRADRMTSGPDLSLARPAAQPGYPAGQVRRATARAETALRARWSAPYLAGVFAALTEPAGPPPRPYLTFSSPATAGSSPRSCWASARPRPWSGTNGTGGAPRHPGHQGRSFPLSGRRCALPRRGITPLPTCPGRCPEHHPGFNDRQDAVGVDQVVRGVDQWAKEGSRLRNRDRTCSSASGPSASHAFHTCSCRAGAGKSRGH